MKTLSFIILLSCLMLIGCKSEPTLQKYFVENTEDKDFIALDVSPTILNLQSDKLTAEQKEAVDAFEKMNILAFKLNDSNKAEFEKKREEVTRILKDEKYQELMKFGKGKEGASLSFIGDENNIKEFVLYATKQDMGFAVIRILGKDMDPTDVMNLMTTLQQSNVNMDQLKPLQEMFANKK